MATALPSRGPAASKASSVPAFPPNQTLYVTNLPSAKVQKSDLKTSLYMLFSPYGPVLDVVALKTMKMRGQAHVVFRDTQAATQALRSLDGSQFLGRDLKIQYAKTKSDIVAKLDGTYKMPGSAATNVEMTETQQSIFNAPAPSSSSSGALPGSNAGTSSVPNGLPARPPMNTDPTSKDLSSAQARGQKRQRDEEEAGVDGEEDMEESDEDVAMEEDSDEE